MLFGMEKGYSLDHIPNDPGVYVFKDKKATPLYIGKAKNLKKRIAQYFSPGSVWKQEMLSKAQSIDFFVVQNESESLYLESNLIKKHQPFFNTMLKGANAYAYIKLSNHPVPQVSITRKKLNDGAMYIGPKHNTRALKKFLQYLRQVLQYRSCPIGQFNQKKLCSDYYFGLCKGWCAIQDAEKPEYPKLIVDFFNGKPRPFEELILKKIDQAILEQKFERASKLRDIYFQIGEFTEKQYIEFAKNISGYLLEIRQFGDIFVYVLLHFYQGKLIDIVRHHFPISDLSLEEMLITFNAEFGDFSQQETRYTTKIIRLKKEEKIWIKQLFDSFFESYFLVHSIQETTSQSQLLTNLQERYWFSQFPYQIEFLDISHFWGEWTSGWLVSMVWGILEKRRYKHYKLERHESDDYAALKEVITRRFKLEKKAIKPPELTIPNLFILDGGKGQLKILTELLQEYPIFLTFYIVSSLRH